MNYTEEITRESRDRARAKAVAGRAAGAQAVEAGAREQWRAGREGCEAEREAVAARVAEAEREAGAKARGRLTKEFAESLRSDRPDAAICHSSMRRWSFCLLCLAEADSTPICDRPI